MEIAEKALYEYRTWRRSTEARASQEIRQGAFHETELKEVHIPDSVEEIGGLARLTLM